MNVFLDAGIDPRVREAFTDHEVITAAELGWQRLKDNVLVSRLQDQFDVLVTTDQGFEHQQNLKPCALGYSSFMFRETKWNSIGQFLGR